MTCEHVPCPDCGAPLDIDPACVIDEPVMTGFQLRNLPPVRRLRVAPVALCTGCEFCVELTTDVDEDDARHNCGACGKSWFIDASAANDPAAFCSRTCEREATDEHVRVAETRAYGRVESHRRSEQ